MTAHHTSQSGSTKTGGRPGAPNIRRYASTVLALLASLFLTSRTVEAQSYTLSPAPYFTALDTSGNPINGACIWTYVAGSSTLATTYENAQGAANDNPIQADPAGRASIFLVPGNAYKFIVEAACTPPSHGSVIRTIDNIAAVPPSSSSLDVLGTAGATLTAGSAVYLSDGSGSKTQGLWYPADSTNTYSSTTPIVGIVPSTIASASIGTIRLSGSVTGLSSLTVGANYYVSTAGSLTASAPANKRLVGQADTTTSLIVTADPAVDASTIVAAGTGITVSTSLPTYTVNANSYILNRQVTTQTVANTAAETAVYTYSVPANTLSTNKTLHLKMIGDLLNDSGGSINLIVRVKYGATTIYQGQASSTNDGTNRRALILDSELTAGNATNAQRAATTVYISGTDDNNAGGVATTRDFAGGGGGGVTLGGGLVMFAVHNAVAEDSTASKDLVITFQAGSADALMSIRALTVYTELK